MVRVELRRVIWLLIPAVAAPSAYAVEGGLGRSITGLQVTDYAGIVPPSPGLSLSLAYIHYAGDISASKQIPLNGRAVLGLDAKFDLFSANLAYVWPTAPGRWNFASLLSLPVANVDISASLTDGPFQRRVGDDFKGKPYDISFVPILAGYHIDKVRHLSFTLYVSAPTGSYDASRLANPSLNVWVYSPTIGYTQLGLSGTLDWSTTMGVDISSWNHATDYKSGSVFHIDTELVKHTAKGWSFGATAGWTDQLSDDRGALADRLDGFKGRSLAAGGTLGYEKKFSANTVSLTFRWLHEFDVRRRLRGSPLMLSGTVTL